MSPNMAFLVFGGINAFGGLLVVSIPVVMRLILDSSAAARQTEELKSCWRNLGPMMTASIGWMELKLSMDLFPYGVLLLTCFWWYHAMDDKLHRWCYVGCYPSFIKPRTLVIFYLQLLCRKSCNFCVFVNNTLRSVYHVIMLKRNPGINTLR